MNGRNADSDHDLQLQYASAVNIFAGRPRIGCTRRFGMECGMVRRETRGIDRTFSCIDPGAWSGAQEMEVVDSGISPMTGPFKAIQRERHSL